jgi:hypothetical protein
MDNYKQLDNLLSNADWYYMRSDDNRTYKKGLKEMKDLIQMRLDLPDQSRAEKIWSKHTPFTNNNTK